MRKEPAVMSRYWIEQIARVKAEDAEREREAKQRAEDDNRLKAALAKVDEAEDKIKQAKQESGYNKKKRASSKRGRRHAKYYPSDDDEESGSEGEEGVEEDYDEGAGKSRRARGGDGRRNRRRGRSASPIVAATYSRKPVQKPVGGGGGVKKRRGEDDYLQWGKEIAPLLTSDNSGKMYGLVGKRYKRSLKTALRHMVTENGPLKSLLTDDEKAIFEKNKSHVDRIIQSEDMSVNPFDGDMAPVGRTVMGVLQEVQQGESVSTI